MVVTDDKETQKKELEEEEEEEDEEMEVSSSIILPKISYRRVDLVISSFLFVLCKREHSY